MNYYCPILIFCFFSAALVAETLDEKALRKLTSGQYKEAILSYKELANQSTGLKRAEYLKQLAKALYADQEHAEAFKVFLEALETVPKNPSETLPTDDERLIYNEALNIYLDTSERDSKALSLKLRDLYAGLWRLHPDYNYLGYVVAAAYANLGEFDDFFDIFFRSYTKIPEHFLAYKTEGVLHIKLFEKARTPEEKERERELIIDSFEKAKRLNPKDTNLYRLQVIFTKEGKKRERLEKNLKEIIHNNMMISRADLSFYFDQLLAYGQLDLAEDFLAKARKWYPYSRTLDAAEQLIKEKTSLNQTRGANGTESIR